MENKFRAYDKDTDAMSEGLPILWLLTGEPIDMEFGKDKNGETGSLPLEDFTFYLDQFIITMWTGLKDQTGKEIYEGDIIVFTNEEADNTPYIVPKVKPETWEELLGITDSEFEMGDNGYDNIKVIGNVYQNLELAGEAQRMGDDEEEYDYED